MRMGMSADFAWAVACWMRVVALAARVPPSLVGWAIEEETSFRMIHGLMRVSEGRVHFPGLKRMARTARTARRRNANSSERIRPGTPDEPRHAPRAAIAKAMAASGMRTGSGRDGFND